MWQPFKARTHCWSLSLSNPSTTASAADAAKHAHELRVLDLLLPLVIDAPPARITKRESPDFEVESGDGSLFVEIVDAVPDAISGSHRMNIAQRRSCENLATYRVGREQFGAVIARQIHAKRRLATTWLPAEPNAGQRLVLVVNGGVAPFSLRHYFPDPIALATLVGLIAIDPFTVVALGDETGAFVWGQLP